MSRILWTFAWIGVAIWSLFALAAYGLVDLFGGLAARHADQVSSQPETVEWLSWMFSSLRSVGTAMILFVWGFVSLAMLSVPWLFSRFLQTTVTTTRTPVSRPPPRRDGVIDLEADQYVVMPPGSETRPPGPVPRIDSRR